MNREDLNGKIELERTFLLKKIPDSIKDCQQ
jgi:hypothetical protein